MTITDGAVALATFLALGAFFAWFVYASRRAKHVTLAEQIAAFHKVNEELAVALGLTLQEAAQRVSRAMRSFKDTWEHRIP